MNPSHSRRHPGHVSLRQRRMAQCRGTSGDGHSWKGQEGTSGDGWSDRQWCSLTRWVLVEPVTWGCCQDSNEIAPVLQETEYLVGNLHNSMCDQWGGPVWGQLGCRLERQRSRYLWLIHRKEGGAQYPPLFSWTGAWKRWAVPARHSAPQQRGATRGKPLHFLVMGL